MKNTIYEIQAQSMFCNELMIRLNNDVQKAKVEYGAVVGHTRMMIDIIRLRRELNKLRHMLNPWE